MNVYYTGDLPINRTKSKYLCKKYYKYSGEEFIAGKYYDVMEIQHGPTLVLSHIYFLMYPDSSDSSLRDTRPYVYDYFYTTHEERKFKLNKLNDVQNPC